MAKVWFFLCLLLIGCSSGGGSHHTPPDVPGNTSGWVIGPTIKGKNYSVGMPARPTALGDGWTFNFPGPGGHVNAVLKAAPSLAGKTQIVMRFSVTGGGFMEHGGQNAGRVGIQLQRRGDDWSGQGAKQYYRWYSRSRPLLKAGEHTLTVPLDLSGLHDVYGKSDNAEALNQALTDLGTVSVVFGGQFAAHGAYATQPSTFTLLSIEYR